MLPLILLAAGKSSRMGTPKGLVTFRNRSLLEYQLSQFKDAGGENVYLILGTHIDEYYDHFKWTSENQQTLCGIKVHIIINQHVSWGQFHSVKLGLSKCLTSGALLSPIDSPLPSGKLIERICEIRERTSLPSYESKKGHPVWIAPSLAKKIVELDSQKNRLDHLLGEARIIECQEAEITFNINTIEDLNRKSY